jgi:hypothetical protein
MFARISALATLAALAGSASALQILVPGGDSLWWGKSMHLSILERTSAERDAILVANSMNMIAWTCHDNPYNNFTIVFALSLSLMRYLLTPLSLLRMANNNTALLTAPQPIVSVESNYDCSKSIAANQATQLPGTGYYLQFANALNSTDVCTCYSLKRSKLTAPPFPRFGPRLSRSRSRPPARHTLMRPQPQLVRPLAAPLLPRARAQVRVRLELLLPAALPVPLAARVRHRHPRPSRARPHSGSLHSQPVPLLFLRSLRLRDVPDLFGAYTILSYRLPIHLAFRGISCSPQSGL